jgi:expansin (peptidoglycan-binding protein)
MRLRLTNNNMGAVMKIQGAVLLLGMLALLTGCGGSGSGSTSSLPQFYKDSYSTQATFYSSGYDTGVCSFGTQSSTDITAVSVPLYNNASVCGAYIQVTGDKGTAIVKVIDECTGSTCDTTNELDLSSQAFGAVTTSIGSTNVTWKYVEAPVGSNTIKLYWGSVSPYFMDVVVDVIRHPVSKVEVQDSSGSFVTLTRNNTNHFSASVSGVTFPGTTVIRLTDMFGNQVQDTVTWAANTTTTTTVQFPPYQ